jgi:outer membrane protein OmpA-like peptidoglycan-associated protein
MLNHRLKNYVATAGLLVMIPCLCSVAKAQSSTPDAAALIEALKEKGSTRGYDPATSDASGEAAKRRKIIQSLQRNETRGLSVEEHGAASPPLEDTVSDREVDDAILSRPSSDIEIYFDYDSAAVTDKAKPSLGALGKSLRSDELKGQTFILAGHTDAAGGNDYNQDHSRRRALAVKQ